MTLRRWMLGVVVLGAALMPAAASAQVRELVPDAFLDRTRPSGDRIRFCVNSASAIADFDRAVARTLGDILLLDVVFYDLVFPAPPYPYEYGMGLPDEELFIQISNNCDAMIGYPLPEGVPIPEWLTPTRAYYLPRFALALAPGAPETLAALPAGTEIGSRIGISADIYVRAFFRSGNTQLKRRVYPTNASIIRDLTAGKLSAAIIWEPGVAVAAKTDPAAAGIRTVAAPFQVNPLQLAIVLPTNQLYLRGVLDPAIEEFRSGGGLEQLLSEFALPAE